MVTFFLVLIFVTSSCEHSTFKSSTWHNTPFYCLKYSSKSHCFHKYCKLAATSYFQILQQIRSDTALLTKEEGGSPIRNPSTAAEDARLASLISLDGMLKQVKVSPADFD